MKKISFVINTAVNELEYVKLLLSSLKENLDNKEHEILVFVENDNQGTYDYLKSIQNDFNDLKIITHKLPPCIGYSRNNNLLVELAKYDIVSYLQSDMVISPHYDTDILSQIEPNTILSATRVEPPLHGESDKTITKNFGLKPSEFDLKEWNKYSITIKREDKLEYFFAPITFYKDVWLGIGGYDTLFRRSREDSDLVQRCVHKGIKLKQTFNAVVYHFTCTSSRGNDWFNKQNIEAQNRIKLQEQADRVELRRFIRKWGAFNHGETKLVKYDVDLIIRNCHKLPFELIHNLEPLFSRVWLDDENIIKQQIYHNSKEHELANKLLNFTKDQWDIAKPFYNVTNYDEIFLRLDKFKNEYNVLLEIDGATLQNTDMELLNFLHLVLKDDNEKGQYEFGNIKIHIKSKTQNTSIFINNPSFDMGLLKIE